jgi:hypothetical protein
LILKGRGSIVYFFNIQKRKREKKLIKIFLKNFKREKGKGEKEKKRFSVDASHDDNKSGVEQHMTLFKS